MKEISTQPILHLRAIVLSSSIWKTEQGFSPTFEGMETKKCFERWVGINTFRGSKYRDEGMNDDGLEMLLGGKNEEWSSAIPLWSSHFLHLY